MHLHTSISQLLFSFGAATATPSMFCAGSDAVSWSASHAQQSKQGAICKASLVRAAKTARHIIQHTTPLQYLYGVYWPGVVINPNLTYSSF